MNIPNYIIETGVDKLVKLVKESGRVSVPDAAKILNLSTNIIMEWADFLEEEGIISIEYKLTKPFLIERKLTKKEVETKSKEFETKRDIFVRKSEIALGFLEKQAGELRSVKEEFDKLKHQFGIELETVKNDLKQLEDYEREREGLINRILSQKQESEKRLNELTQKISMEERKLKTSLFDIKKEQSIIAKEGREARSVEKYEKFLMKKLNKIKNLVMTLDEKVKREDETIKYSEQKIDSLKQMLVDTRESMDAEREMINPLLQESQEQEGKILELQKKIINKIKENKRKSPNAKIVAEKIKKLLKRKFTALELVDRVNNDRDLLEKELIELIKKAKSFQLTSNSAETEEKILELESKFKDVEGKKKIFDDEYKELISISKS